MLCLSRENTEGLQMSGMLWSARIQHTCNIILIIPRCFPVKVFTEMGRYLFSHGVHFILSERFTQDPVESFFGHQRQWGGGRDNPTAQQFMQATQAIWVQHSSKPVSQSNVRGAKHHIELDIVNTPVPKRRRMKQSKLNSEDNAASGCHHHVFITSGNNVT